MKVLRRIRNYLRDSFRIYLNHSRRIYSLYIAVPPYYFKIHAEPTGSVDLIMTPGDYAVEVELGVTRPFWGYLVDCHKRCGFRICFYRVGWER